MNKRGKSSQHKSKHISLQEAKRIVLESEDELSLSGSGKLSNIKTDSDSTDDTDIYNPTSSVSNTQVTMVLPGQNPFQTWQIPHFTLGVNAQGN